MWTSYPFRRREGDLCAYSVLVTGHCAMFLPVRIYKFPLGLFEIIAHLPLSTPIASSSALCPNHIIRQDSSHTCRELTEQPEYSPSH